MPLHQLQLINLVLQNFCLVFIPTMYIFNTLLSVYISNLPKSQHVLLWFGDRSCISICPLNFLVFFVVLQCKHVHLMLLSFLFLLSSWPFHTGLDKH